MYLKGTTPYIGVVLFAWKIFKNNCKKQLTKVRVNDTILKPPQKAAERGAYDRF